jgi:hypothetical protein
VPPVVLVLPPVLPASVVEEPAPPLVLLDELDIDEVSLDVPSVVFELSFMDGVALLALSPQALRERAKQPESKLIVTLLHLLI